MAPGYGTASVAFAAGPTVVSTFLSHCVTWPTRNNRPRNAESSSEPATSLETLPGNQLRYEEGLRVVKRFLEFASQHGVEEVQGFTAQPVPVPRWVRREVVTIPDSQIDNAASILAKHLATYGKDGDGLKLVGGSKWWRVRGRELEAEWIEMRKDYDKRMEAKRGKRTTWMGTLRYAAGRSPHVKDGSGADVVGDRVIFYIHGGAFFFSSLDMHRYQIQRHARKAGARAFVPNYRLSPQYPFPCGLHDVLAAYLYLLDPPPGHHSPIAPENIVFMGDSAGGGMCLSLLIVIREMGLPMPAAASLMSPWVDLTHSMPSIVQWDGGDYIPSVGFHYKPSVVWPPAPGDGIKVDIDGKEVDVDDQIQLYCPNTLLTHPLVSPINNGSLGGLCPMYFSAGGAELLRDEIIYTAHKAANPTQYPPSEITLEEFPDQRKFIDKYPPTYMELQVFEGACHVATTLAWTRSAKQIFRGTANFNIWAFNDAPKSRSSSLMPDRSNTAPGAPQQLAISTLTPASNGGSVTSSGGTPPEPIRPMSTSSDPTGKKSDHGHLKIATDSVLGGGAPLVHSPGPASAVPSAKSSTVSLAALAMLRNTSGSGTDADEPPSSTDEEPATGATTPASGISSWTSRRKDSRPDCVIVKGYVPAWGEGHMVSERVSVHGRISPMEPVSSIPALDPKLRQGVGRVTGHGPIRTWIAKRAEWDKKYAKELKQYRDQRIADRIQASQHGFLTHRLQGENPPLASLAGLASPEMARKVGKSVDAPTHRESKAVALWAHLAEIPDEEAVKRDKRKSGEERRSSEAKQSAGGRTEEQRKAVDAARRSVDLGRVASRKSGEAVRKSGEQARKSEEHARKSEEHARKSGEQARVTSPKRGFFFHKPTVETAETKAEDIARKSLERDGGKGGISGAEGAVMEMKAKEEEGAGNRDTETIAEESQEPTLDEKVNRLAV